MIQLGIGKTRNYYERKDEKFIRNFIKEEEVRKMKISFSCKKEISHYYVMVRGEELQTLKRLERVINAKARDDFSIKAQEDGYDVFWK